MYFVIVRRPLGLELPLREKAAFFENELQEKNLQGYFYCYDRPSQAAAIAKKIPYALAYESSPQTEQVFESLSLNTKRRPSLSFLTTVALTNKEKSIVQTIRMDFANIEISRFNDTKWFDDNIVTMCLDLLAQIYPHIQVMTSFHTKIKKKNLQVKNKNMIFFPVNLNGNHWILVVLNLSSQKWEYYDSLRNEWDKKVMETLKNLHPAIQTITVPESIPKQFNTYDCGIFVIYYALYIASGKKLSNVTWTENLPAMRKRVLLTLYTNQNCLPRW